MRVISTENIGVMTIILRDCVHQYTFLLFI